MEGFDYVEPEWACKPTKAYKLEVLKNGIIISDTFLPLDKTFVTFGRLPTCDVSMEHASVSRVHAVLQFGPDKACLYDLASTHGTFVNKIKLEPQKYTQCGPDSIIKFGESSRSYILTCQDAHVPPKWKGDALKFLRKWLKDQGGADLEASYEELEGKFRCEILVDKNLFDQAPETDIVGVGYGKSKKEALESAATDTCIQIEDVNGFADREVWTKKHIEVLADEDLNDPFFDRASSKQAKVKTQPKVETAESLYKRLAEAQAECDALLARLWEAEKVVHISKYTPGSVDDLDRVLLDLKRSEAKRDVKSLRLEFEDKECELADIYFLLKIADPKGEFDPLNKTVVESVKRPVPLAPEQAVEPKPVRSRNEEPEARKPCPTKEEEGKEEEEPEDWMPPTEESAKERDFKEKHGY